MQYTETYGRSSPINNTRYDGNKAKRRKHEWRPAQYGKIVIGPKGNVTGNIVSANAEILGEVEGSIRVSAKLVLKATAVIKGDIFAQTLEIEPNARFNGICKMSGEESASK